MGAVVEVALGAVVEVRVKASAVFVLMRIGVEVASSRDVAITGGKGEGVACAGGLDSDNESEIPPITNKSEMMAMITPPPI